MTTRLVIADDQALVRAGLRKILEGGADIRVVGEAENGQEAVSITRRLAPDVVVMDIRMPVMDGIAATRKLTADGSQARILVLTTFHLDEYVYEALRAGASGFLLKDAPPERLLEAIDVLQRGDALLDPSVTRTVIDAFARTPAARHVLPSKLDQLTERERQVFNLVARGHSNAEIARQFFMSEGTIKTHVAHILSKLGVRDRIHAVIYAYESGFIGRSA